MKCLAGIVTYNPDIELLKENIRAIKPQVKGVLIVDNKSKNIQQINEIIVDEQCELISLNDNYGIAYALNQILDFALENQYDFFLTLDQDSICSPVLIELYIKYLNLPSLGALTCCIVSDDSESFIGEDKISEVNECITSGCFCKTSIVREIGGFDSSLFIDCVDNDLCINLLENGYKIYRVNSVSINHNLGDTYYTRFLGRKYIVYSELPFRHYYISRNWILLSKKYKKSYIRRVIRIWLKSFLLEKNKLRNTKATIYGIYDGLHGVTGKIRKEC